MLQTSTKSENFQLSQDNNCGRLILCKKISEKGKSYQICVVSGENVF
jgi:hypothetical protein